MKCKYCGTEIENGSVFCNKCGKAVQIVPDYNEFDDDYLNQLITEGDSSVKKTPSKKEKKEADAKAAKKNSGERKRIILFSCLGAGVILIVFCCIMISFSLKRQRENSYDYQLNAGEEAYSEKDYRSAETYYENALKLWETQYDGYNIELRIKLIDLYRLMKDDDAALVMAQEVARLDPTNAHAYQTMIDIYSSQGKTDEIVALSQEVTDPAVLELFSYYMVTPPSFSLEEGEYEDQISLEITCDGDDQIYYTMEDVDPTTEGELYKGPLVIDEAGEYTVSAICKNSLGLFSNVTKATYTITYSAPEMPVVSPDGGDFTEAQTIYVTIPEYCTCYYTWDETEPTTYSDQCFGTIDMIEGNNVLSIILIDTRTDLRSDVYRGRFTLYLDDSSDEGEDGEAVPAE